MSDIKPTLTQKVRHVFQKRQISYRQDLVDQKIILSLSHVKQFFDMGGGDKTKAVHDVSFDVYENECFGLVGESGCGKTTTGRCINRLYDITSGSIYYKGYRISGGTRWNEKEIKWSRIHTKEKVKALLAKKKEELASLDAKHEVYSKEINHLNLEMDEEIKEKNDPTNENNDEIIANIRSAYAKQIAAKEALRAKAIAAEKAEAEAIEVSYGQQVFALNQAEKTHIAEQKAVIRQINFDNTHVNRKLLNEIQMIFQDPVDSLDPRMTVEDIIQEGLHIQHIYDKNSNQQKVADILNKVGLIPEYASRYPHEFSGGQRQRIGIARALIMNPKFLICDEPISALDVSIRAQILNLLNDVKKEMGITILFIAHDLSVVKYFCDRIAVMYYGNLVELATSDELFRHPLHPYTKSLLSAIPKPDPLSEKNRKRIIYKPAEVHDYTKEKPTFQEILPGHFVLANSVEMTKYKEEIREIDEKKAPSPAPAPEKV